MSTPIIVAVIVGVATVIAAIITTFARRKRRDADGAGKARIGNVKAGRDAVVVGGDAFLFREEVREDRFISKEGGKLVIEVSKSVISDDTLRRRWSSFDTKFLYRCIKDTPRGMTFDGEAFQEFRKPENDQLFGLGVQGVHGLLQADWRRDG